MKLSLLATVLGFATYASAAPAPSTHVVHEKREVQHDKWTRRSEKLNRDALIPMSIGLTQRNLENGYDFLMDVSHPESPNYGKHWSVEKVRELKNFGDCELTAADCGHIRPFGKHNEHRQGVAH
jgi:tripeptidyl-peptidase-1